MDITINKTDNLNTCIITHSKAGHLIRELKKQGIQVKEKKTLIDICKQRSLDKVNNILEEKEKLYRHTNDKSSPYMIICNADQKQIAKLYIQILNDHKLQPNFVESDEA